MSDLRSTLSYPQRRQIDDALRQVCHQVDGYAVYDPGHSDATVAASMPFQAKASNVASIRKQRLGHVRPPLNQSLSARVERLEADLAALRAELEGTVINIHTHGNFPNDRQPLS